MSVNWTMREVRNSDAVVVCALEKTERVVYFRKRVAANRIGVAS